ncbi:MAG: iron ABC transporter permease [Planctomycetota bacterium]
MSDRRVSLVTVAAFAALLAGLVIRLTIPNAGVFHGWAWPEGAVVPLRLSRMGTASLVGASLALAGVYLQTLMRNPLASPSLLGLSSGAALGVTVAAYLGYSVTGVITPAGSPGFLSVASVVGCGGTLGLVYLLASKRGLLEPVTLVLVGVVIAIVAGAATQAVQRLLPDGGVAVARMLVGTVRDDTPTPLLIGLGLALASSAAAGMLLARSLDALALDDDEARSVGVRVGRVRLFLLVSSGLLTAGAVVAAGPIGFVGLVVPHAVRLLIGPAHGPLILATALAGAAGIVWADALVAAIRLPSGRLPIGVLTAVIGGPAFLWLVRREMTR